MKLSRLAAAGAGLALVAASTFGGATAASADDFFVTTLGAEGASYPAGWFTGAPAPTTAPTFGPTGLTVTGRTMILNGTVPAGATLTSLTDDLSANASGTFSLQIPVFLTGAASFTSIINANDGMGWRSSAAIPENGNVAQAPLTGTVAELAEAYPSLAVLAYGVLYNPGDNGVITSIDDGINTHYFAPQATLTSTPNPVTTTDFATAGKGITITATGFLPGDEVIAFAVAPNGEDNRSNTGVADANGSVTITIVWDGVAPVEGTYELYVSSEDSETFLYGTFEVKKALAATGLDTTGTLAIGGILLLAGAGLALVTLRRKGAAAL